MRFMKIKKLSGSDIFLVIVMLELFLMGSGRFLEIGPVTLRMLFFAIAVFYSITLAIYRNHINKQIFLLVCTFIVVHLLAFLIGSLNNARMYLMLNDIKPLLFFFMLIFFCTFIRDMEGVNLTIKTIKAAALILALPYLLFLLFLHLGIIHLDAQTIAMIENHKGGDIRFQQHIGVFYNGFFYLGVGFFFYALEKGFHERLIALLLFTAIVLTFSRGLLLAMTMVFFLYLFFTFALQRKPILSLLIILFVSAAAVLFLRQYLNIVGNKYLSNVMRIIVFNEVVDSITPLSVFFGHGFGIGTAQRPIHMEVSFLEIFHKQGIIGLLFWAVVLIVILKNYSRAFKAGNGKAALPFVLSCLYAYVLTATNNYINNPAGMSVLLISIVVLDVLGKNSIAPLIRKVSVYEKMSNMQIAD
ncbi:MAG: hypothetical protein CVV39_02210 [Planctomycetes bacterium HGW-Planctomycetes-1]|nr:MAG: hypothetical protein CVV39_02210 [Planctomycetes bacterium HGW-Planctomycetes-1]